MNAKQVKELRAKINAAHAANDMATAAKLQAILHAHFEMEADEFFASDAGKAWQEYIMLRP